MGNPRRITGKLPSTKGNSRRKKKMPRGRRKPRKQLFERRKSWRGQTRKSRGDRGQSEGEEKEGKEGKTGQKEQLGEERGVVCPERESREEDGCCGCKKE